MLREVLNKNTVDIPAGVQGKKVDMENPDTVISAKFYSGGELINFYAGTFVRNCSFQGNYAVRGGAVCNLATRYEDHNEVSNTIGSRTPVFESCIFEDNHAITNGGAVYNAFFTRTTFITCAFTDNTSGSRGGAVYADKGSPVHFMNILFSHNEAERGAALSADGSSNIRLIYATFACNMAYDTGAAIYLGSCLNKQTDGSPFIGNEAHLYKSLVISNVSITSPSSISSQHDSIVTFDEQSVVETVDGTMNAAQFLAEKNFASKSAEAGFHPARKVDVDSWTDIFDGDENRMYLSYEYDTFSASSRPGTIYVNDDATAGGDGTSWATAFCDLNLALEQAAAGSRIWVAKGVYTPTDGPERFAAFVMKKGVDIYGGFNGNETTLKERDWETNKTILSGDIGRVGDSSDNSYHVVFGASDSLLDGFVVQAGRTVVTHNTAVSGGGGIALDYKGALLDEKDTSVIEDNVSTSGMPDIDNATSNFVYEPTLYSGR